MTARSGWRHYAPYAAAAFLAVIAKLPTLNNNILFVDEPLYLAQARRLELPERFFYSFQYISETKFPVSILPHLLALQISQPNAILLLRLFGLAAVVASACFMISLSGRAFLSLAPGFVALTAWLLFLNKYTATAAIDLEYFQLPLVLLGLWFLISGLQHRRRRDAYMFCSGLSLAFAGLVKPPGILIGPVFLSLLLFYVYVYPGEHWQQSVKSAALLLLGVAAPLAVFLLPYLSRPETIPDLRFNFIDLAGAYSNLHNLSYLTRLLILLASFPVSAMIIIVTTVIQYLVSRFVFHRRRWDETGIFELAMLLTGGVLLYGYVAGQVKPHYIVAIMPPLMLFAGHRIWLFHKSLPGRNLPTLFLATLGLFIVALETDFFRLYSNLITDGGSAYAGQMPAIDARSIAGYIEANSASQDTIWVYYNAPEIYWLANREPATNDPTGSWVMEMHNQFWFHRTHEQLLRDRPIFIVGIAEPRYPANIPALTELPLVKNLLAEQYACDFTLISKVTICRRKADE